MSGTYRVLLVDDDDATAVPLAQHLQNQGVHVDRAVSGTEALSRVQKGEAVDVLVVDAVLPGLGGVELAARLNATTGTARPVVVLSARVANTLEENEAQRAWRVDAVFRRPVAPRELLARLDAVVMLRTGRLRAGALGGGGGHASTPPGLGGQRVGVPPLQGECSLPSLAAVLVHAFEHRLSAVMDVTDAEGTRQLAFHDGLLVNAQSSRLSESLGVMMVERGVVTEAQLHAVGRAVEREGGRVGELAVAVAGVPAVRVAECMEAYPAWLLHRVMRAETGTFQLRAWKDSARLGTVSRADPVRLIVEACRALPSEEAAHALMAPTLGMAFHRAECFEERLLVLRHAWPGTRIQEVLAGNANVQQAVAHARVLSHEGVRQLLALIMTEALKFSAAAARVPNRRAGVLAPPARAWCPEGTPPADQVTRSTVAQAFLRMAGRSAWDLLGMSAEAAADDVAKAVEGMRARLGPPALDDASLGAARSALEITRSWVTESARILKTPGDRAAHRNARGLGERL